VNRPLTPGVRTVAAGPDGFAGSAFAGTVVLAAAAVLAVLLITYLASRRAGRHSVIDTAWGLLFCAVAVVAFGRSGEYGNGARRVLLLAMTLLWGIRLAVRIFRRSLGKGEDPRYAELLRDRGTLQTLGLVYGLQGVLALLVAAPLLVGSFERGGLGWLAVLGLLLWAVGLLFEAIGDWQLDRYQRDKAAGADVGPVLDSGLWRYTRHPNYFGDACVWLGVFCVSAERWPGVLTFFSPVIMVYLLAFGSGKRVLERSMAGRPGYRDYMARTSGFLPMPPRRGTRHAQGATGDD
jgi:steroid 5-alpha reductase family enzyme